MSNRILIVTGLSGAGRTSALKILEDFGFEAIDNIPFFLLKNIIEAKIKRNLAVGIDIRSRDFDAKKIMNVPLLEGGDDHPMLCGIVGIYCCVE